MTPRLTGLTVALCTAVAGLGCGGARGDPAPTAGALALPQLAAFLTEPSDRFLVDVDEISRGHPFLGAHAPEPHAGAHVHFDNTANRWPGAVDEPAHYPAIYAVADGVISRVDPCFGLPGGNERYGVDLTFARDRAGSAVRFCYSIEPLAPEPCEGFYKKFILVEAGQRVSQGQVIAYLFTPPGVNDCHIHFHLLFDGGRGFLAPAIFAPQVVQRFVEQCGEFCRNRDGTLIPPCMGYRISAEESPFGSGPQDAL